MEISVIMSVYNEPITWLKMSIDSILNQTFRDFEFIIVCDNPDYIEGIETLRDYEEKDNRVKIIFNEKNIGLTKSLNKALVQSTGKYIARMDADDESDLERFMKQYNYLEAHPNVIVLGTDISYIGDKPWFQFSDAVVYSDENIRAQMLFDNCIAHSSVMMRKSVLDANNILYDETFRHSQDYRMWELLAPYGEFDNLHEKLLHYRLSTQQITKSKTGSQSTFANSVRMRWQKKWLDKNSINYTVEDLENNPSAILDELRKHRELYSLPEYSVFVQYVYLNSGHNANIFTCFKKGDVRHFSFSNIMRLIAKTVR